MTFRIGQRVRVVRDYPIGVTRSESPVSGGHIYLGCEAIVLGTESVPNVGFNTGFGNVSIRPIGGDQYGMAHTSMLEPIQPSGHQVTTWAEMADLWQPDHLREMVK